MKSPLAPAKHRQMAQATKGIKVTLEQEEPRGPRCAGITHALKKGALISLAPSHLPTDPETGSRGDWEDTHQVLDNEEWGCPRSSLPLTISVWLLISGRNTTNTYRVAD